MYKRVVARLPVCSFTHDIFTLFLIPLDSLAKYFAMWGIHVSPSQGKVLEKKGQDERGQDHQKMFILGGRERKDKNLRRRVNLKRGV